MSCIKLIINYFIKKMNEQNNKRKQLTFIYCPKCNNELIKNGTFIKDIDLVYYECSQCGKKSKWLFDAPTPILIEEVINNE